MRPRDQGWWSGRLDRRIGWRTLSGAGIVALALASCAGPQVNEPDANGVVWTRLSPSSVNECIWPDADDDSLVYSSRVFVPVFESGEIVGYAPHFRNTVSGSDGTNPIVLQYLGAAYWNDFRPRFVGNQRIVFMDNRQGSYDIWFRNLETLEEYRLLTAPTNETAPAPRHGTPGLVYVELYASALTAYDYGRLVLIPDTTAVPLERIYLTPDTLSCGDPDWDPTGTRLCFSVENRADLTRNLYTMSFAPGDTMPVRITSGASHDVHPRWSPDGGRIVFASDRTGRSGLWVVHPDGEANGLKLVAFDDAGATALSPAWTEDGASLVVSSDGRGPTRALWQLTNLPVFGF